MYVCMNVCMCMYVWAVVLITIYTFIELYLVSATCVAGANILTPGVASTATQVHLRLGHHIRDMIKNGWMYVCMYVCSGTIK